MLATLTSFSQSNAWITGSDFTRFTTSGLLTEPLPQPGGLGNYAGAVAKNNQYIEYSLETGILFFIIDSNIYDRDGFLIADSEITPNCRICLPMSEANLTTAVYPGYCDKFWIFFSNQVAMLDLSIQNVIHPTRKGHIIDWDDPTVFGFPSPFFVNYVDGDLVNFSNANYVYGIGGPLNSTPYLELPVADTGGHPIQAVLTDLYDDNLTGEKYLVVHSENAPYIYSVDHTGVWIHQQWSNTSVNPGEGLPYYNSVEIVSNPLTGNVLLATSLSVAGHVGFDDDNLYIFTANSSFVFQSELALNAHIGGNSGSIGDLVFSPNADYVYFGLDAPPYFGYYQISTNSFGDLSAVMTLAQAQEAGASQLEINQVNGNAVLFFAGPNGVSYLTSPNNPSQAQLVMNAIPNTNLAQLNSQTPYSTPFLLQHQQFQHTYNDVALVNDCCEFFADQFGEPAYDIEGSNAWAPGSTPFEEVNGVVHFEGDLVFGTGSTTIINDLEFRFGPLVKVVIKAGAYVELNNSVWTANCDQMWLGTELLGTTNANHSISQSSSNQGRIRLNDSTIEHARIGIKVGTNATNSGGIVYAYDSRFRNNARDVQFLPYRFVTAGGNTASNLSRFHDTYFITDDYLNYPQIMPQIHVEFNRVFGVRVEKCSFMNTTPYSTHAWNQRGIGISAIAASFGVSGSNTLYDPEAENIDATSFYRLHFGIRSTGFSNILASYRCRYQEFQECAYGIVNFQTDNIQVYENNFALMTYSPLSDIETMIRGMYITGSTGYEVQQNYFTFDGLEAGTGLGVWVDQSGEDPNKIRNNHFNRLKLGCYVSNINAIEPPTTTQTGLQILCNLFTECLTDIYRGPKTSMRQDQGGWQSNMPPIYAGNIFSQTTPNCSGIEGDFRNHPDQDVYNVNQQWYVNYNCPLSPGNMVPFCEYPSNDRFSVSEVNNFTLSCAPAFTAYSPGGSLPESGSVRPGLLTELEAVDSEALVLKTYYDSWVDDGATSASLSLVSNAFPSESEFVRDIMLERLPLSDAVLKTFVQNASNYDPWHLTQVFLANSPLQKSFIYELDKSGVLSPFFMSLIHSAQYGINPRHQLERQLMGLATNSGELRKALAHDWLHQEPMDSVQFINVDSLFIDLNYSPTSLHAAIHEVTFGNYSIGFDTSTFPAEIAEYEPLFIQLQALCDTLPLDTTAVQQVVFGYSLSGSPGISSFALSTMHAYLGSDSLPNPVLAIEKSNVHMGDQSTRIIKQEFMFSVYPNPAIDRIMLAYPADLSDKGHVAIFDALGRTLFTSNLDGNGLFEINVSNFECGSYIAKVHCDDVELGSVVFIVNN
jgi:hypothetical protein